MSISETSSRSESKSSPSFSLGSMYDKNEDDDSVIGCGRVSQHIRAELERWQKDNIEYQKYRQQIDDVVLFDDVVGNDNNISNEPIPAENTQFSALGGRLTYNNPVRETPNTQLSAFGGRPASNTPVRSLPNNHPKFMSNTQFHIGTADLGNFSVFPSIIPSAEIEQAQPTVLEKRKIDEIVPKPTDAIEPKFRWGLDNRDLRAYLDCQASGHRYEVCMKKFLVFHEEQVKNNIPNSNYGTQDMNELLIDNCVKYIQYLHDEKGLKGNTLRTLTSYLKQFFILTGREDLEKKNQFYTNCYLRGREKKKFSNRTFLPRNNYSNFLVRLELKTQYYGRPTLLLLFP